MPLLYGVPPVDGRQRQLAAQWWRKTRLSTKRWLKMYQRGAAIGAVVEDCLQRASFYRARVVRSREALVPVSRLPEGRPRQ